MTKGLTFSCKSPLSSPPVAVPRNLADETTVVTFGVTEIMQSNNTRYQSYRYYLNPNWGSSTQENNEEKFLSADNTVTLEDNILANCTRKLAIIYGNFLA